MAHDVFISFSQNDKPTADAACVALEAAGVRCWIAPRDVPAGVSWPAAIVGAIGQSRVMVLVFSSHAVASEEVQREVVNAFQERVVVVPLRIEDVRPAGDMAFYMRSTHWLDAMTPPLEKHLKQLCQTVASLLPTLQAGRTAAPGGIVTGVAETPRKSISAGAPNPSARTNLTSGRTQPPPPSKSSAPLFIAIGAVALIAIVALIKSQSSSAPSSTGAGGAGTFHQSTTGGPAPAPPPIGYTAPPPAAYTSPPAPPPEEAPKASAPVGPPSVPSGWVIEKVIDPATGEQKIEDGHRIFRAHDPKNPSDSMLYSPD